jgi:transposase
MARLTVGVDVGKTNHQAAVYDPAADRVRRPLRFAVRRAGFEQFLALLAEVAPTPDEVLVGVEASGHSHHTLVEFLAERGYLVVLIDPYQATQFRRSQGNRAKTDRSEAQAVARFPAVSAPAPTPRLSETLANLRELTRFRAELVQDRALALNRLHRSVDLAFPELPRWLDDLHCPTALTLLRTSPTAASLAAAPSEAVHALVRQASQGRVGPARVAALLAMAQTSVAVRRLAPALALKVQALARQVTTLDQELADLEVAIEAAFATLGVAPQDFPAGGPISLATLLAEAGDVHRFPSAKQFLAHFGWCSADTQNGAYKDAHPRLSEAGNHYVRRLIWRLAIHTVSQPGPYRDSFQRRTAIGKNTMDTLVAIGRKRLTTSYAIRKSGQPYDPTYRPACLRPLSGSPLTSV